MKSGKFDIHEFFKVRPLSWSAVSSFEYNPDEWYKRYIQNIKQEENLAMKFGKTFAESIEKGKPLAPVTIIHDKPIMGKNVEHKFEVVFNKVPLIGFADTFCHKTFKKLGEFKTARTLWTQQKVDQHGQITMYCLMNLITNKIKPEDMDIFLECIQTKESGDFTVEFMKPLKVHHFKTKRTMSEVLAFGTRINNIVKDMQLYAESKI